MKLVSFAEAPVWAYGWFDDAANVRRHFLKVDDTTMRLWGPSAPLSALDTVVEHPEAVMVWVQGVADSEDVE